MLSSTTAQRTKVLIILGYGDNNRTQQEVCNLFNIKYLNKPPQNPQ